MPVPGYHSVMPPLLQFAEGIIVLIDVRLSYLMIDHDVGVSTISLYPVNKIDADFLKRAFENPTDLPQKSTG